MPEADDVIGRFDWYGARADTAEAAIKEFEEFEKSGRNFRRRGGLIQAPPRGRIFLK